MLAGETAGPAHRDVNLLGCPLNVCLDALNEQPNDSLTIRVGRGWSARHSAGKSLANDRISPLCCSVSVVKLVATIPHAYSCSSDCIWWSACFHMGAPTHERPGGILRLNGLIPPTRPLHFEPRLSFKALLPIVVDSALLRLRDRWRPAMLISNDAGSNALSNLSATSLRQASSPKGIDTAVCENRSAPWCSNAASRPRNTRPSFVDRIWHSAECPPANWLHFLRCLSTLCQNDCVEFAPGCVGTVPRICSQGSDWESSRVVLVWSHDNTTCIWASCFFAARVGLTRCPKRQDARIQLVSQYFRLMTAGEGRAYLMLPLSGPAWSRIGNLTLLLLEKPQHRPRAAPAIEFCEDHSHDALHLLVGINAELPAGQLDVIQSEHACIRHLAWPC